MEVFMSLADFSTAKANSTASGELCLAPQEMGTGEDTEGKRRWSAETLSHGNPSILSVVSPLMCWLRAGPPKRVKIESWASGSADKISEIELICGRFFPPRNTCGFMVQRCFIASCYHKENWKNSFSPSHTGSSPALTRLFALQSAKQISLPLENQVNQTCQRCVAQLKALEDHPQCDKRYETISWPPTTTESHNLNVKWLTASMTPS